MRVITHCPACQTQFFATEEQLNKHDGMVRCGQCMHVFDARAQLVNVAIDSTESTADTSPDLDKANASAEVSLPSELPPKTKKKKKPAITVADTDNATSITSEHPAYLSDSVKNDTHGKKYSSYVHPWQWGIASALMMLVAAMQSMYFLRSEIASYYPNTKPYLQQACQVLSCSISLAKQIESIVIDDSDIQEDADHPGLMRFSSTLFNTGSHILAYPNLELTLTDVEDKPVLRRIFKPDEYLPAETRIAEGFNAGEETKIKLAITSADIPVAGYRVFVTY